MKTEEIILEFNDLSLARERKPFPIIYLMLDASNLEVRLKIFVHDKQNLELEVVKQIICKLVDVKEWEQERDITCVSWELYGTIDLSKVKRNSTLRRRVMETEELDAEIEAGEDVANLNYQQGKREGVKEILDKIGGDYTNHDGWIIIPMLNWREIRKQYRKI